VKGSTALLFYAAIALVFYLLLIRPQRRRQRELVSTRSALEVGAEVMLTSGIFGRVVSLEDETIHLELAPGTRVKVARQAVVRVVEPVEADDDQGARPEVAEPEGARPEDAGPENGSRRSE
jgi:preprotein translocase subunit YajC